MPVKEMSLHLKVKKKHEYKKLFLPTHWSIRQKCVLGGGYRIMSGVGALTILSPQQKLANKWGARGSDGCPLLFFNRLSFF